MKKKYIYSLIALILALGFGGGVALGAALAERTEAAALQSNFTYSGYLEGGSVPITDTCDLEFKLWDDPSVGSQIGSTVTKTSVSIADGIFSVQLDFGASSFDGDDRYLEIGVKCTGDASYTTLGSRQPLTPVPYAMLALDTLPLENIITVAKTGGDFTTIQAAIDHAAGQTPSDTNRFLVYVAPGVYSERVAMAAYVGVQGAGKEYTKITASGGPTEGAGSATVTGASDTTLRDLTVENTGNGASVMYAIGIFNVDVDRISMENVSVDTESDGSYNYGILNDNVSHVYLTHVSVYPTDGSEDVIGVYNRNNAGVYMTHVDVRSYKFYDTGVVIGIDNQGAGVTLTHVNVGAQTDYCPEVYGIRNNPAIVYMESVSVGAYGGGDTIGIKSYGSIVHMSSVDVNASGGEVYGITNEATNDDASMVDIHVYADGYFNTFGIANTDGTVTMTGVEVWSQTGWGATGIENTNATVDMYDVIATGVSSGSGNNGYGLLSWGSTLQIWDSVFDGQSTSGTGKAFFVPSSTTAILTNVTLRGSGVTTYGIDAYSSSGSGITTLTLHNVIFESAFTKSIYASDSGISLTIKADDCIFNGPVEAVHSDFYIATSQFLSGASITGTATFTCQYNYDNLYAPFTCP